MENAELRNSPNHLDLTPTWVYVCGQEGGVEVNIKKKMHACITHGSRLSSRTERDICKVFTVLYCCAAALFAKNVIDCNSSIGGFDFKLISIQSDGLGST